jgi:sortase A
VTTKSPGHADIKLANRDYIYQVFDRRVVGPGNLSVTEPVEGRNVVSLQTCTLPDYHQRLVVRAELVDTRRA